MRSDYALYTVSVIFFILTATSYIALQATERAVWIVSTVVLGLLFIGLGYSQRPKTREIEISSIATPPEPLTISKTSSTEEADSLVKTTTAFMPLTKVRGIGGKRAEQLKEIGIYSIEKLVKTSDKDLATKLDVSPKVTSRWIENAKKLIDES